MSGLSRLTRPLIPLDVTPIPPNRDLLHNASALWTTSSIPSAPTPREGELALASIPSLQVTKIPMNADTDIGLSQYPKDATSFGGPSPSFTGSLFERRPLLKIGRLSLQDLTHTDLYSAPPSYHDSQASPYAPDPATEFAVPTSAFVDTCSSANSSNVGGSESCPRDGDVTSLFSSIYSMIEDMDSDFVADTEALLNQWCPEVFGHETGGGRI